MPDIKAPLGAFKNIPQTLRDVLGFDPTSVANPLSLPAGFLKAPAERTFQASARRILNALPESLPYTSDVLERYARLMSRQFAPVKHLEELVVKPLEGSFLGKVVWFVDEAGRVYLKPEILRQDIQKLTRPEKWTSPVSELSMQTPLNKIMRAISDQFAVRGSRPPNLPPGMVLGHELRHLQQLNKALKADPQFSPFEFLSRPGMRKLIEKEADLFSVARLAGTPTELGEFLEKRWRAPLSKLLGARIRTGL